MDWIFSDKGEEAEEEEAVVTSELGQGINIYVNRNGAYGGNDQWIHDTDWDEWINLMDERYLKNTIESLLCPQQMTKC